MHSSLGWLLSDHCYAAVMTHRLGAMAEADIEVGRDPGKKRHYAGLTVLNGRGDRHFNGVVRTVPEALEIPLRWRKPRMIFVNSMSDLFHKDVPFEFIDQVFAVMALCPQHTFQILTKRPERMSEYLNGSIDRRYAVHEALERLCSTLDDGSVPAKLDPLNGRKFVVPRDVWASAPAFPTGLPWPLPGVWLGTSIENQATADERIPHLLRCPAAVRFISAEPLLGEIVLPLPWGGCPGCNHPGNIIMSMNDHGRCSVCDGTRQEPSDISWVILGGESGPGARPCDLAWINSIRKQCESAGCACFVKQLGKCVDNTDPTLRCGGITDPKGGDPSEWHPDLRVREFPIGRQEAQNAQKESESV